MFRVLIHPSSGACNLCAELFHGLYWSGSMCVGVTLWYGCGGVVSICRLKHYCSTTQEITQHTSRKLLRMDVLTSETCWALNKEIIKEVTSSWSLFTQLSSTVYFTSLPLHIIASLQDSRYEDHFSSYVAGNTLVIPGWPRVVQRWREVSSASSKETLIFWNAVEPFLHFFANYTSILPSPYINSSTFITVSLREWQTRNPTNYQYASQWNHLRIFLRYYHVCSITSAAVKWF